MAVPSSDVKVRRHPVHTGLGPRVRVRPWAFDRGVVQLALADQGIVPTVDEIRGWVDTLDDHRPHAAPRPHRRPLRRRRRALRDRRVRGHRHARPAAHRPLAVGAPARPATPHVTAAGPPPRRGRARRPRGVRRPVGQRRRRPRRDPPGDAAAPGARPVRHRRPTDGALGGFAITGAAAGHGYLQRLAVAPDHQGQGHGRALVLDSLRWMRARRLGHGLVNTAVDNERALGLYESVGFQRLPDRLVVMQFDVAAPGAAAS